MISLSYLRCVLFILASAGATIPAEAWWNSDWTVRKQITVDTGNGDAAISEPIGSAVVLLRLHDGNFQFTAGKEDGSDIRAVAEDDKTLLPIQLERFDSLLNEGFLWVKLPEVKPGAKTVFWLYYGNTGEKPLTPQDAKATYQPDTQLVFHFGEKGTPPNDAAGKGNTTQNPGVAVTGSLIGGGLRLDGRTPLTIPANDSLVWVAGTPFTCSLWVKPSAFAPNAGVLSRREEAASFVLGLNDGTPFVEINGVRAAAGKALEVNTWHHLAVVAETGKTTLYVDGEVASSAPSSLPALRGPLFLGGETAEGAARFAGEIDELTLAKVARPAGWMKLATISQGSGERAGKLITLGNDEESGGGGGGHAGYFGVIVSSLTVDGWVVIGLLGVMLVISWWVMVTKVLYLNAMSKGNAHFMKAWENLVDDLTLLDHGSDSTKTSSLGGQLDKRGQRAMRQSSVYRIYHIGVEEIRHRLAAERRNKALSALSVQSIRASLDGALVREKQRIDKLIVLLTICISGGPFLGLLGTVVGVMITFAAVAAAGDVNVNAIAPGIAAALLATVAGLAVAIPSLFGYNYILARVKDATADMHVFIDEFVTRMAEFYAEGRPRAVESPSYSQRNMETELPEFAEATV